MFSKKKKTVSKKIETIIGKETTFSGKLESGGSIRIDGSFEGDVTAQSEVFIGEHANVKASIKCNNVILAGQVEGDINTEEKLDIRSTGVLIGDAQVGSLVVEDGAVFTGTCKMSLGNKPLIKEPLRAAQENRGDDEEGKNELFVTKGKKKKDNK